MRLPVLRGALMVAVFVLAGCGGGGTKTAAPATSSAAPSARATTPTTPLYGAGNSACLTVDLMLSEFKRHPGAENSAKAHSNASDAVRNALESRQPDMVAAVQTILTEPDPAVIAEALHRGCFLAGWKPLS